MNYEEVDPFVNNLPEETLIPDASPTTAAIGEMIIVILIILAIALVVYLIAGWMIFKKAGIPGWKSIVPFYGWYLLVTQIAGRSSWTFWAYVVAAASLLPVVILLAVVPVLGMIFYVVWIMYLYYLSYLAITVWLGLSKNFGKDNIEFMALMAYPLTTLIGLAIIAFGSAEYKRSIQAVPIANTPTTFQSPPAPPTG